MALATITQFCTWGDVAARYSAVGARLRVDDNMDATQQDILNEAAMEVVNYLGRNYDITSMSNSNQVKYYTRDVACYLAGIHRGNPCPGSIKERYDKTVEALQLLQRGSLTLSDIAMSKMNAPVLSNLRVQTFPISESKVVQATSTGKAEGYGQAIDQFDVVDYSI